MIKNVLIEPISRPVFWVDYFSVGVSMLCLAHCLLMPILLVSIPTLNSSLLASESVHLWLIYVVIPFSLFALSLGCKQHKHRSFMVIGLCGLSILVVGAFAHSMGLNHDWEQRFTVLGSLLIAFAHVRNFQLCQKSHDCECH